MSQAAGAENLPDIPVMHIRPPTGWWDISLKEVWRYRDLVYFFVWKDVKIRYKQTAIGAAWAIIQPLMTMIVFSLFFGRLAHIPSEGLPYPIFYYCALLPWTYFATTVQNCTTIIVDNQTLVTRVYFPRLILPLSAMASGLVDMAIAFLMLVGMLAYYRIWPGWPVLLLPAFLLLAILTALGIGLWLSALNAIYRDVRYVVPFLIQFWLFASPVIYPSTQVPARWRWLYGLNPMAGVIEGFRWSLTGRGLAPGPMLAASAGGVIVFLLAGLVYFRKMETTFADVV